VTPDPNRETAATGPAVHTRPVAYEVSAVPWEYQDGDPWSTARYWSLRVEYRPDTQGWGVTDGMFWFRRDGRAKSRGNATGPGRGDRWVRAYRMPLDEALALAARLAPRIKVADTSAAGYIARREAGDEER
jgi:hypothetical protein